jgi:hypothetical protein
LAPGVQWPAGPDSSVPSAEVGELMLMYRLIPEPAQDASLPRQGFVLNAWPSLTPTIAIVYGFGG